MKTIEETRHSVILLFIFIGLCSIICSSLYMRVKNPGLTINSFSSFAASGNRTENIDETSSIGNLMRQVASEPDNIDALSKLIEQLLAARQWDAAENFAQRALSSKTTMDQEIKILYLLSLAHHNKGEHQQAAEILEKLLTRQDNPSARYSLGILYTYYLNKAQDGKREFEKTLSSAGLSPSLQKAVEEELAKYQ